MSHYKSQTPDEAMPRIRSGNMEAAISWLEQVGSWPSDDDEIEETTIAAENLLNFRSWRAQG